MKLDMDNLSKYDLTNAKVGDKLIVASRYGVSRWFIEEATIKSVSSKRRDITFVTFNNCKKVDIYGRRIGAGRWDNKYYTYLEYTQENIAIVNSYIEGMDKVRDIVQLFGKIEKQGFKMLYDLPEDKISVLHKTLQEVFGAEND